MCICRAPSSEELDDLQLTLVLGKTVTNAEFVIILGELGLPVTDGMQEVSIMKGMTKPRCSGLTKKARYRGDAAYNARHNSQFPDSVVSRFENHVDGLRISRG